MKQTRITNENIKEHIDGLIEGLATKSGLVPANIKRSAMIIGKYRLQVGDLNEESLELMIKHIIKKKSPLKWISPLQNRLMLQRERPSTVEVDPSVDWIDAQEARPPNFDSILRQAMYHYVAADIDG